jgi:hypothetical protein
MFSYLKPCRCQVISFSCRKGLILVFGIYDCICWTPLRNDMNFGCNVASKIRQSHEYDWISSNRIKTPVVIWSLHPQLIASFEWSRNCPRSNSNLVWHALYFLPSRDSRRSPSRIFHGPCPRFWIVIPIEPWSALPRRVILFLDRQSGSAPVSITTTSNIKFWFSSCKTADGSPLEIAPYVRWFRSNRPKSSDSCVRYPIWSPPLGRLPIPVPLRATTYKWFMISFILVSGILIFGWPELLFLVGNLPVAMVRSRLWPLLEPPEAGQWRKWWCWPFSLLEEQRWKYEREYEEQ